MVGCCYDADKGIDKDKSQAAMWYQKAAEQGYCAALYNIGVSYWCGLGGLPKDPDRARQYYQRAADQGDEGAISQLKEMEDNK